MEQQELFPNKELIDPDTPLKKCISCKKELPISAFEWTSWSRRDGTGKKKSKCRECVRDADKTCTYLKTKIPYPEKNYCCPICGRDKENLKEDFIDPYSRANKSSWCLDHDHETKKFRGWLCNKCNSALGWFNDDINYLRRAVKYLENNT